MDGNGRWATRSGLPRSVGHERGVDALRKTVTAGQKLGLSYLTVYSFSTENWRRPASEVGALFSLLRAFIKKDLKRLKSENVRISVFGTRSGLPQDICDLLDYAVSETSENTRFNLGIAFNYGGREEIARAARRVAHPRRVDVGARFGDDVADELFTTPREFDDIGGTRGDPVDTEQRCLDLTELDAEST